MVVVFVDHIPYTVHHWTRLLRLSHHICQVIPPRAALFNGIYPDHLNYWVTGHINLLHSVLPIDSSIYPSIEESPQPRLGGIHLIT